MDGSLPELRTDWLLGRSVLVAENRAQRPNEFGEIFEHVAPGNSVSPGEETAASLAVARKTSGTLACPFCRGQEHRTPPAVFELAGAEGQWRTRVVPNMFPAVMPPGENATPAGQLSVEGELRDTTAVAAIGAHEVIIESPRHVDRMSSLSVQELRGVLETYAQRIRQWRDGGRFTYGLVFKNQGPRAGASLAHVHSQLVALSSVPPTVAAEYDRAAHQFRQYRSCPYCRIIEQERAAGVRMIDDTGEFVAFCPFASVQPFEAWLMPAQHEPFVENSQSDSLDRLAPVLFELLRRIEAIVPDSAYNMLVRTAPWLGRGHDWCHWRIEILPRTSAFAGFELASGMFINSLAPERAASKLRSI